MTFQHIIQGGEYLISQFDRDAHNFKPGDRVRVVKIISENSICCEGIDPRFNNQLTQYLHPAHLLQIPNNKTELK